MSETRIIYDMKDADYRAVDAYGSTVIKTAATLSVKHARTGRPDSTSLSRGRLIHALVLEPDEVEGRYAVQPAGHGNSKAVREAKAVMKEAGIIPVSPSDWDACNRSADSVRKHPLAGKLLSSGKPEVSMFWTHESGAKLKSRIDWHRWRDPSRQVPAGSVALPLRSAGSPLHGWSGGVHWPDLQLEVDSR
jgi:hypothetical protein